MDDAAYEQVECHAHAAMDGVSFAQAMARHVDGPDEAQIRAFFEAYQSHGISFVRDGGDKYGVSKRAKQMAGEYGIDYRSPIFAIHRNGRYGGIVGRGFDDLVEYESLVDEAIAEGADFIKIMTAGIMDFEEYGRIMRGDPLDEHEVRSMVRVAHDRGMAVMAHVNGARAVQIAAEAGVESVEHANFLDERAIEALAEHGTCLVPTMAVTADMLKIGRANPDVVRRICESERASVHAAWEAGVLLACGSDAGAVGVPHGQGALDEYACLVRAIGDESEARKALTRGNDFIRHTFKRRQSGP